MRVAGLRATPKGPVLLRSAVDTSDMRPRDRWVLSTSTGVCCTLYSPGPGGPEYTERGRAECG